MPARRAARASSRPLRPPPDRGRHSDRMAFGQHRRFQIRRRSAAVSPGSDLRARQGRTRTQSHGRLNGPCRLPPRASRRSDLQDHQRRREDFRGQDDIAGVGELGKAGCGPICGTIGHMAERGRRSSSIVSRTAGRANAWNGISPGGAAFSNATAIPLIANSPKPPDRADRRRWTAVGRICAGSSTSCTSKACRRRQSGPSSALPTVG